jgi:hypothetical protein
MQLHAELDIAPAQSQIMGLQRLLSINFNYYNREGTDYKLNTQMNQFLWIRAFYVQ